MRYKLHMVKGEVTVFLSLLFVFLISFIGAVIESASVQISKNYKRTDMSRAIESVFAEYQIDLLEEYNIFALESTYEMGTFSYDHVLRRLEYYGAVDTEQSVKKVRLLTDNNGKPFFEQAVTYMEHKLGVDAVKDILGTTEVWKNQKEKVDLQEEEERNIKQNLDSVLQEGECELPTEDNPLQVISDLKKSSLLSIVLKDDSTISTKKIAMEQTVSGRTRRQGYGTFREKERKGESISKLLFGEYLLEHFGTAQAPLENRPLDYELEYIVGGMASDRENLEAVVKRLIQMRYVPNYTYLLTDTAKKAEAEALALTLSTSVGLPLAEGIVKQAILLAWAYGESVMDVRSLLDGKKVPLLKTNESWQLSLSGLLKLGGQEDNNDGTDVKGGLTYQEYLRILLFLEKKETLSMRALDLIEKNLQLRKECIFFRADQCISNLEIHSICHLRRGITYDFNTCYSYQ